MLRRTQGCVCQGSQVLTYVVKTHVSSLVELSLPPGGWICNVHRMLLWQRERGEREGGRRDLDRTMKLKDRSILPQLSSLQREHPNSLSISHSVPPTTTHTSSLGPASWALHGTLFWPEMFSAVAPWCVNYWEKPSYASLCRD